MSSFTYNQWLSGKEQIPATEKYYKPKEWEKIKKKQEEIFHTYIEEEYQSMINNFEKSCKRSIDKTIFIHTTISSLGRILNSKSNFSYEEIADEISEGFVNSIQSLKLNNPEDYKKFRICYNNVLEGKFPSHLIYYPKEKVDQIVKEKQNAIHNEYGVYKVDEIELIPHIIAAALHKFYYEYILIEYVDRSDPDININSEKIKWLGSPSQFGYLISELVKKEFIEPPKTRGTFSYSKLAELCFEKFEIKTTIGTLKAEVSPKRNHLTSPNRKAFRIPYLKDLS